MSPKKLLRKYPSKLSLSLTDYNQEKGPSSIFALPMIVYYEKESTINLMDIVLAFGIVITITSLGGSKEKRKRSPPKNDT